MQQNPFVIFGVASYGGAATHEFQMSTLDTKTALLAAGISSETITVAGDPYLSKARNRIAADFLMKWPNATHLFMIDDDVGWPGHKVVEFLMRDIDVLGGVYPKKNDNQEWPTQLDDVDGMPVEKDGLYLAKLVPTGFLCVKRHVMEKLAAAAMQYFDTTHATAPPFHWNIFDMGCFMPDGTRPFPAAGRKGEFWGEDYYFCRKWRDMGGEIWIDPDIQFSHTGKKTWRGNMKPSLDLWLAQEAEKRAKALKAAE